MPNLIKNPGNVARDGAPANALSLNYRRTQVGTSRFGTRTLQMYEIHIYGLSDAVASNFYVDSREIITEGNEFQGMGTMTPDQPVAKELSKGNIVEAIIRGVQVVSEVYLVGQPDIYSEDPNYNDLVITVVVAADTFDSGWEQYIWNAEGNKTNPNATYMENEIGNSVDKWADDNEEMWDGIDVYPAYLQGDGTNTWGPPFALAKDDPAVVALRAAKKAKRAEVKASLQNAKGFTPKMKRPS